MRTDCHKIRCTLNIESQFDGCFCLNGLLKFNRKLRLGSAKWYNWSGLNMQGTANTSEFFSPDYHHSIQYFNSEELKLCNHLNRMHESFNSITNQLNWSHEINGKQIELYKVLCDNGCSCSTYIMYMYCGQTPLIMHANMISAYYR